MYRFSIVAVALAAITVGLAGTTAQAQVNSDGSMYFDTFDGGGPTGGVNVTAGADWGLPGRGEIGGDLVFVATGQTSEMEWRAELSSPPQVQTAAWVAEVSWTVDLILNENATVWQGFDIPGDDQAGMRVEAKPADSGNDAWQLHVNNVGFPGGLVGPELPYGQPVKLVGHNKGDGTIDLWANDTFVNTYTSLGTELTWFGNIGNNSSGGNGGDMSLHYVSLGNAVAVPEPASLALIGLGGLAMLRRRR